MADPSMLHVARIPAGEVAVGADDGEEDERPLHKAYLDEFCIGTYPVTNGEYAQFVTETGHPSPVIRALPLMVSGEHEAEFRSLAEKYFWKNGTPPEGRDRHPVTLVGFEDALSYCAWLASKTAKPVRLPTEAEWEKAARGGLESKPYPWGDTLDSACAHFLPPAGLKAERGTAEVGSYPPNGFELFDMSGNVWEWVSDWYAPNYYARAQYVNPQGPDSGLMRIVRGGAWVNTEGRYLRCAYRHKVPPDSYAYSIGFRIAYSAK
ncbi:MAG TPA: formylglycine-generating enzyme family protein [Vicinamibacterales bacterium]|jgi:formylglycine-generating enzyme required for sulfatase activity|nr:formylglycine-generating enzyme family protein [Vicinamibacterales bacterium]